MAYKAGFGYPKSRLVSERSQHHQVACGVWDVERCCREMSVFSFFFFFSFFCALHCTCTYFFREARPIQPADPLRYSHPPHADAQVDELVGSVAIGRVVIGEIQGHHGGDLQVAILVVFILSTVGQERALIGAVAAAAGSRPLGDVSLQLPLQRSHLLLELGQAQLAGLVELGPQVHALPLEPDAVVAGVGLVAPELAAATLEAGRDHAHPAADGFRDGRLVPMRSRCRRSRRPRPGHGVFALAVTTRPPGGGVLLPVGGGHRRTEVELRLLVHRLRAIRWDGVVSGLFAPSARCKGGNGQ